MTNIEDLQKSINNDLDYYGITLSENETSTLASTLSLTPEENEKKLVITHPHKLKKISNNCLSDRLEISFFPLQIFFDVKLCSEGKRYSAEFHFGMEIYDQVIWEQQFKVDKLNLSHQFKFNVLGGVLEIEIGIRSSRICAYTKGQFKKFPFPFPVIQWDEEIICALELDVKPTPNQLKEKIILSSYAGNPEITRQSAKEAILTLAEKFPEQKKLLTAYEPELITYICQGEKPAMNSMFYAQQFHHKEIKETEVELATVIDSCTLEVAALVVEVFFFLFSIVGFKLKIPTEVIAEVARKIIESGRLLNQLKPIVDALYRAIKINDYAKAAQHIVEILILAFNEGIFSIIIDVLSKEMSWWDWTLFSVAISANMTLWVLGGFLPLLGKIIVGIADAFSLIDQIVKVVEECS